MSTNWINFYYSSCTNKDLYISIYGYNRISIILIRRTNDSRTRIGSSNYLFDSPHSSLHKWIESTLIRWLTEISFRSMEDLLEVKSMNSPLHKFQSDPPWRIRINGIIFEPPISYLVQTQIAHECFNRVYILPLLSTAIQRFVNRSKVDLK